MNIIKILKTFKAQQKIILLCFIALITSRVSHGQIRFIKTLHGPENYWESAIKMVELKDCYLIPIQSLASVVGDNLFYILKLSKNGKVISRNNFNNWDEDRGPLFNAGGNNFWKLSVVYDTSDWTSLIEFSLFNSQLNKLLSVRVPRTFPTNGMVWAWPEYPPYIRLSNGDFIFMLGVSAMNWKPFDKRETMGNNFIYIICISTKMPQRRYNA